MTALDWGIVAFALLMGVWGYRQGLIVGFFSLAGFVGGAFLGARLGPALLADGSESPYAPLITLASATRCGCASSTGGRPPPWTRSAARCCSPCWASPSPGSSGWLR